VDPGAAVAVEALFAPPPPVADHAAVRAAVRLARDVLAPHAAAADDPARGVDPAHLALLADAGLFSVTVPLAEGGLGGDARVDSEVLERLSGACGATWFVHTQHQLPQVAARGLFGVPGPAAARHRAGLAAGTARAGIALAHLRRPGPPALRATPDGTGWRFTGEADWCTGWGLIDLVMIAAIAPGDRIVLALLPAQDRPGLRAGPPLRLSVMGGTRTVALTLDDLAVGADDVLAVHDGPAWRAADAERTANATPASLGLLRRVVVALADLGEKRDRPEAVHAAFHLGGHGAVLRDRAYALIRDVPPAERLPDRTALRGELAALTVRAAHALVAARSGSGLLAGSPEQRWAREAAFHMVQAQTAAVRAAQLTALAR
jgi:alkylation response protein AidB-like acyl-CoA dehydrogenase